jgi:hypothetical protein
MNIENIIREIWERESGYSITYKVYSILPCNVGWYILYRAYNSEGAPEYLEPGESYLKEFISKERLILLIEFTKINERKKKLMALKVMQEIYE